MRDLEIQSRLASGRRRSGQMLGAVTVDDVIDAMVRETTEDVQKFGGIEALDAPYMRISLAAMVQKARGLARGALPRRDADGDGDGALPGRDRARPWCSRCSSR